MLPPRQPEAEIRWVAELSRAEPEQIEDWVRLAIKEGRPQLAGRLILLLSEDLDPEDPALMKAQRVAKMLCFSRQTAEDLDEMQDALDALREGRLQRRRRKKSKSAPQGARWWGRWRRGRR